MADCGRRVKVGVLGCGWRGRMLAEIVHRNPDAELVAVCDFFAPRLKQCITKLDSLGAAVTPYEDFDAFLNHDMDAVVLANYATEHAPFAVRVLDSGRHVMSEVLACQTMAEAVALVEAVERNPNLVYSFAENYCCLRGIREMQRLYQKGDIGEFLSAQGEYVHYLNDNWCQITYGERNHWRNWASSCYYCTHAFGPIVSITGTRPVRLTAYETPNVNRRKTGSVASDGAVLVCQMDNGGVVTTLRAAFRREPECAVWYSVYGSEGMMETDRWGEMPSRVHVYRHADSSLKDYSPAFPFENQMSQQVTGHWGADYFPTHFFLQAILDRPGKEFAIDVYRALDMTLPGILGYRSIWEKNLSYDVPDLRNPATRDAYRNDNWGLDKKMAGPGQPEFSSSFGRVDIPDSLYESQVKEYLQSLEQ